MKNDGIDLIKELDKIIKETNLDEEIEIKKLQDEINEIVEKNEKNS